MKDILVDKGSLRVPEAIHRYTGTRLRVPLGVGPVVGVIHSGKGALHRRYDS